MLSPYLDGIIVLTEQWWHETMSTRLGEMEWIPWQDWTGNDQSCGTLRKVHHQSSDENDRYLVWHYDALLHLLWRSSQTNISDALLFLWSFTYYISASVSYENPKLVVVIIIELIDRNDCEETQRAFSFGNILCLDLDCDRVLMDGPCWRQRLVWIQTSL